MKKTVDAAYFEQMHFVHGLCANRDGVLCFATRKASIKKNTYTQALWVYREGVLRCLPGGAGCTGFCWHPSGRLLTAQPEKKRGAARLWPATLLKTLDVENPAQPPQPYARIPMEVEEMRPLAGGDLLLLCQYNAKAEAALQQANGNEAKAAQTLQQAQGCRIINQLPFWENGESFTDGIRRRLYYFEYKTGHLQALTDADSTVETFALSHDETRLYYAVKCVSDVAPLGEKLFVHSLGEEAVRDISVEPVFRYDGLVPMCDGRLVVVGSNMQAHGLNQNPAFYVLDVPTGAARPLDQSGRYSAWSSLATDLALPDEARWFEKDGRVYFTSVIEQSCHLLALDVESGIIELISREAGAVQEIAPAENGVFATAMRGLHGPEVYWIAPDGTEKRLTHWNDRAEKDWKLAVPQLLQVSNSVGVQIQGYVLPPPDTTQPCPAVLYIHGGPKAAYGDVVFHELQFLAAQGYAVLYANPTGGDGRGDAFADIRGRYGSVDYDDLMRFVDAALQSIPWIDPTRLGVLGGSYGGYMVNWIIGHTHRFKAAVSQRSVANWVSMALTSDIGHTFVPDQTAADLWKDTPRLWRNSPLCYAPQVQTPTLFLHSEEDYRCPASEGLQMYAALKLNGVPSKLVLFAGENHELSRSGAPQNRLRRLQEIVDWLQKWL